MPLRRVCSFCGRDIEPGTGKLYIRKDGTVFFFCSGRCQASLLKLGRLPRWTPWTMAYRRAAGVLPEAAAEVALEEVPAAAGALSEVVIETPKGRDIPSDLVDLIDKRLGPDLSRGDIEEYYHGFVESETFRTSIVGWAKKAHAGKPVTHVEKPEFLAYKDSPEGRRVFKAWLDEEWGEVKGKKKEEAPEEAPPAKPKRAKKGA